MWSGAREWVFTLKTAFHCSVYSVLWLECVEFVFKQDSYLNLSIHLKNTERESSENVSDVTSMLLYNSHSPQMFIIILIFYKYKYLYYK